MQYQQIKRMLCLFDDEQINEKQLSFLLEDYSPLDNNPIEYTVLLIKKRWRRHNRVWWFDPMETPPCTPYFYPDAVIRQTKRNLRINE